MVKLDRPAEIALKALSYEDRNLVNHAIARLRGRTAPGKVARSFGRYAVKPLRGGLHMLTVQQRLGILFREVAGDVIVLDILPAGRLSAMYSPESA